MQKNKDRVGSNLAEWLYHIKKWAKLYEELSLLSDYSWLFFTFL